MAAAKALSESTEERGLVLGLDPLRPQGANPRLERQVAAGESKSGEALQERS